MTRAEQETIFRYAADEKAVSVFTAHPPTARKLERFGYMPVKRSTQGGEVVGWFYQIPLKEFRWRVGAKKSRTLSESQRTALAERLKAHRASGATNQP